MIANLMFLNVIALPTYDESWIYEDSYYEVFAICTKFGFWYINYI